MKKHVINISFLFLVSSFIGYFIGDFITDLIYDVFEVITFDTTIFLAYVTVNLFSTVIGIRLMSKETIEGITHYKLKTFLLFLINWLLSLFYFFCIFIMWLWNAMAGL